MSANHCYIMRDHQGKAWLHDTRWNLYRIICRAISLTLLSNSVWYHQCKFMFPCNTCFFIVAKGWNKYNLYEMYKGRQWKVCKVKNVAKNGVVNSVCTIPHTCTQCMSLWLPFIPSERELVLTIPIFFLSTNGTLVNGKRIKSQVSIKTKSWISLYYFIVCLYLWYNSTISAIKPWIPKLVQNCIYKIESSKMCSLISIVVDHFYISHA